jgi:hypothetical protein
MCGARQLGCSDIAQQRHQESCDYEGDHDGHDTRSIQDYLGHKAIQHTVRYTELSPVKFKEFWRD